MTEAKPRKTGRKTARPRSAPIGDGGAPADRPANTTVADGLDAEIRRRAYEIYLSRGGTQGDDLADWLEAERLVHSRRDATEQRTSKGSVKAE